MQDRLRVLWVIKGLGPGGAEKLLVDHAFHGDRGRFAYRCCYLLPWKDQLAGKLRDADVSTTCIGGSRGVADPRWLLRLRREAARADIVHTHSPVAGVGARLVLAGQESAALIGTEHNTRARYRPLTRTLNDLTFSRQDAAIAVSQEVARSFGRVRVPIEVIPNGVDVEALRSGALAKKEAREALGLAEGPVIGTVGGITRKKGYDVLVNAARMIRERIPQVRFVWIGLPIEGDELRSLVAAGGLGDTFLIAGYREDAARYMNAFDVFCLPSRHEGMPLSLLEAMALGVPSVATDVGGVGEIASRGGLEIVRPEDPPALARGILALLDDEGRRDELSEKGAEAAGRSSLQEMVGRIEDLYVRVARARGLRSAS